MGDDPEPWTGSLNLNFYQVQKQVTRSGLQPVFVFSFSSSAIVYNIQKKKFLLHLN